MKTSIASDRLSLKSKFLLISSLFLLQTVAALAKKPPILLNTKTDDEIAEEGPLTALFSPEKSPGSGSLTLTLGDKIDTFELGAKSGLFANGLVLHSSALPTGMKEEFSNSHFIQIAMGTLGSHVQHQLPQFGAITLISKKIPSHVRVFEISRFEKKSKSNDGRAMLMFSPPTTSADQDDEQRLKSTFFAQSGKIIVTPLGSPQVVSIQGESETFSFKTQKMRFEFRCDMANPFNPTKSSLAGSTEISIYWPNGPKAAAFVARISSKTIGSMLQNPRDVTTDPKTKTKNPE